jgi:hypothetical protein
MNLKCIRSSLCLSCLLEYYIINEVHITINWPFKIQKVGNSPPGVTALELIKRAYESNMLEKLRDFLTAESLEFHPEEVLINPDSRPGSFDSKTSII